MLNNQVNGPAYDNAGLQYDDYGPPPSYTEHGNDTFIPQNPSQFAVNTHYTSAPGVANNPRQKTGANPSYSKYILWGCISVAVILTVVGLLVWYFIFNQCLLGKSCRGTCLSHSQWCDGVTDCWDGEDESHCFRIHGDNFILEMYSSSNQGWFPVCYDRWNDDFGKAACKEIGYSSFKYVTSTETSVGVSHAKGYMRLKYGATSGSLLQRQFEHSPFCSHKAVSVHCVECGKSSKAPGSRIVGGTEAVNGAWPWQVSLQISGRHICGGSIISSYWILSAAHCFQGSNSLSAQWVVYAGDVNLYQMATVRYVQSIITHENFDHTTNDYDIALLKLSTSLSFSSTVQPVCLPNAGMDLSAEHQAWITGWGTLYSSGPAPKVMNQAQVTIYSRETCNAPHVLNGQVTETMFCAGRLSGGVDSCQGDSGGPLVVKKGDTWWLRGDTSWGFGCALRNKPGVYGNVTFFTDWIYKQMRDN